MCQEMKLPQAIATALYDCQQALDAVEKASVNTFHKYKYASSDDMVKAARAALNAGGLAVCRHSFDIRIIGEGEGAIMLVDSQYLVTCRSGEGVLMSSTTPVVPERGRPWDKALAGALTIGLSYFLRDLLLIPREEEDSHPDRRDDRGYEPKPVTQSKATATAFEKLAIAVARKAGKRVDDALIRWLGANGWDKISLESPDVWKAATEKAKAVAAEQWLEE